MLCKERFNVKLCTGFLFAEPFGIDAPAHCFIFMNLDNLIHWLVSEILGQGFFPLYAAVIFHNIKDLTFFQSLNDGAVGFKMTHTLKGCNDTNWNRKIKMAFNLGIEKLVLKQVGVGEVKFDLNIDILAGR